MGDEQAKPWTAPARVLVLYCPESEWRFAIYNDAGVFDGRLTHLPFGASPETAQADVLRRVQDLTSLAYAATWKSDRPGWWTAELAVVPEGAG